MRNLRPCQAFLWVRRCQEATRFRRAHCLAALGQFVGATRQHGLVSRRLTPHQGLQADHTPPSACVVASVGSLSEMARDPKVGGPRHCAAPCWPTFDKGGPDEGHPAYWAPFVVVGEGGSIR